MNYCTYNEGTKVMLVRIWLLKKKGVGEIITFYVEQMIDLALIRRLFWPKSTPENHILTPASYTK